MLAWLGLTSSTLAHAYASDLEEDGWTEGGGCASNPCWLHKLSALLGSVLSNPDGNSMGSP